MRFEAQVDQLLRSYASVDDTNLAACQAWMAQSVGLLRAVLGADHPTVFVIDKATTPHLDPKTAYRKSTANNRRRALEGCRAALLGARSEQSHESGTSGTPAPPDADSAVTFISYLREDVSTVDCIAAALEEAGVEVWIDRANIRAGDRWRKRIDNAIASNGRFIACFSSAFATRPDNYMRSEVLHALRNSPLTPQSKPSVIPLRLDESPLPAIPLGPEPEDGQLSDLQCVDWFADPTLALAQLIRAVT